MVEWIKSMRALSVLIFVLGMTLGVFLKIIPVELYSQAAMLVIGTYFAKRDSDEDRGKPGTSPK